MTHLVQECTYWQEKCKDGSIKLSDSVQLLASNLADNLLPESIMRTNEVAWSDENLKGF